MRFKEHKLSCRKAVNHDCFNFGVTTVKGHSMTKRKIHKETKKATKVMMKKIEKQLDKDIEKYIYRATKKELLKKVNRRVRYMNLEEDVVEEARANQQWGLIVLVDLLEDRFSTLFQALQDNAEKYVQNIIQEKYLDGIQEDLDKVAKEIADFYLEEDDDEVFKDGFDPLGDYNIKDIEESLEPNKEEKSIHIDQSLCESGHCYACVSKCPKGAIIKKDGKVEIDKDKCDECGICTKYCHARAIVKT